jgi:ABC-2 type transport system ATP-binding protein
METGAPVIDIETQGLTKRFGPRLAVADLSLSVRRGETFALVGPDGAGKTTVMRLLVGIMDPDGGWAKVLGFDTVAEAELLKERIGYMPQRFGLYDDLTVAENIAFYADLYGVSRTERQRRLPGLLEFAGLAPFQQRLAAQLSGGMRQKLGLVCALSHHPQVLFLDEPTFGVDPVSRREFWEILQTLLQEGLTIFLTTAYLDEAERAHRVGLLHAGRLLAADTPERIKLAFAGELLEVRAADLRAARRALSEEPQVQQILAMGDRLMVTVQDAIRALPALALALKRAGVAEVQLSQAEPGLEDYFVQVVNRRTE